MRLAAFALTGGDEAGRQVPDPHRGLDLVHVLPALAAAAIGVDFDVGVIDLDRRAFGQFGDDIDAGE